MEGRDAKEGQLRGATGERIEERETREGSRGGEK
jgi:hypothetical protein